jgi:large subunit ribosomal protein L25
MSDAAVLTGTLRTPGRKGPARRLRAAGKVPGVIYGLGENVTIAVNAKDIHKIVESDSGFLTVMTVRLEGDGKDRAVMIKKLDVHPIFDHLIHIDLLEIDVNKPVKATVPLVTTGVCRGVKEQGGVLVVSRKRLPVESVPAKLPPKIVVDISNVMTNDAIYVKDIPLADGVAILEEADLRLITVQLPKGTKAKAEGEA